MILHNIQIRNQFYMSSKEGNKNKEARIFSTPKKLVRCIYNKWGRMDHNYYYYQDLNIDKVDTNHLKCKFQLHSPAHTPQGTFRYKCLRRGNYF